MRDFEFDSPQTLSEAVAVLAKHNGSARCLAGGTDLIDHIRTGRMTPERVVDVKKIPELNVLELTAQGLRIGAAVSCARIYEHEGIVHRYSAIADSCHIIGGIQIQSRATLGGNLCNSGPAADSTPSLIALGGVCVIEGPKGRREVAIEQFCTGPGKNALQPGELLIELRFPPRPANSGSHYRRFIPRNEMDIAVVGVGASVELDGAGTTFADVRVALGAVAPTPLFVAEIGKTLAGQPVGDETYAKAAELARTAARPIDDMRGTAEFRKHLVGVLTERVLREAVHRAQGGS